VVARNAVGVNASAKRRINLDMSESPKRGRGDALIVGVRAEIAGTYFVLRSAIDRGLGALREKPAR
jgi:hypothetical protein